MGRKLDRREFAAIVPALMAMAASGSAEAQNPSQASPAPARPLPILSSGTFQPGPPHNPEAERVSRPYTAGMLKAGNIRLEMHETTQKVGAVHEPIGTHLHNEVWCMREGICELNINGVAHRLEAGDTGLVTAGDKHFIKNIGDIPCTYFVITIGPPE